ncbi:TPA: helix-turn-helix domain-containing protein [Stenotrophomonas maltophilia]|uniref:DUF3693 domain-containing protein n=1 Tax=Stenotrophomonas maltophilia TaxID=40324 RepID=UPI002A9516D8|nr:helix-turn-helix domain-containing protein [Stenotrophomonas maltophilia]HEL4808904.1 helix-turn-helix domain-containing protein [Stenotrophomonas maltophilia]HEL5393447.1 helix-turn-helix domain-containing protein [Stenotrophomonas maltophilia]
MDVNSLLDQAKEACGVSYDKDLAPRLGVRPSAISNYRKGVSHPDAVVCATLAGLTGVPLARVLGVIGEARAISREEKAVWRKLAATAMALCLAVGFALPHKAQAAVMGFDNAHAVYIMRNAVSGGRSLRVLRMAMAGLMTATTETPQIPQLSARISPQGRPRFPDLPQRCP